MSTVTITEQVAVATVTEQAVGVSVSEQAVGVTISAAPGPQGAAGPGVPTGGTAGQVLAKASGDDHDTEWVAQSGGGGGAVDSVNGETGAVVLDAADVGAAPTVHTHAQSDVTGLTAALDGKADDADVTALDTRVDALELAPPAHTHAIADTTGLQAALDAKAATGHTHAQADVTNLTSDLALKAPLASPVLTGTPTAPTATAGTSTTQIATTAFVTGADSALDTRVDALEAAPPAHTHDDRYYTEAEADALLSAHASDTTGIHGIADTAALVLTDDARLSDAREPTAHAHPISDVTGLQTALDGKAATSHAHSGADITSGTVAAARLPAASEAAAGVVELATSAETTAGLAVQASDTRLSDARTPTGSAGGVLSGTYPNPGFAADMATQAELDAHTGATNNPHSVTASQAGAEPALGNPASDGYVLSSTAAGSRSWVAQGGGASTFEGYAAWAGDYAFITPGFRATAVGTTGLTANRISYYPYLLTATLTVASGAIEVTTFTGGSSVRFAIYAADDDWQPGAMVIDFGEVSTATNGVKEVALDPDIVLPPGRYLAGVNASAGVTVRRAQGATLLGFASGLGTNAMLPLAYVSAAYGALPDPGTAWDNVPGSTIAFQPVFLRGASWTD
jgi:hypothetical protein